MRVYLPPVNVYDEVFNSLISEPTRSQQFPKENKIHVGKKTIFHMERLQRMGTTCC